MGDRWVSFPVHLSPSPRPRKPPVDRGGRAGRILKKINRREKKIHASVSRGRAGARGGLRSLGAHLRADAVARGDELAALGSGEAEPARGGLVAELARRFFLLRLRVIFQAQRARGAAPPRGDDAGGIELEVVALVRAARAAAEPQEHRAGDDEPDVHHARRGRARRRGREKRRAGRGKKRGLFRDFQADRARPGNGRDGNEAAAERSAGAGRAAEVRSRTTRRARVSFGTPTPDARRRHLAYTVGVLEASLRMNMGRLFPRLARHFRGTEETRKKQQRIQSTIYDAARNLHRLATLADVSATRTRETRRLVRPAPPFRFAFVRFIRVFLLLPFTAEESPFLHHPFEYPASSVHPRAHPAGSPRPPAPQTKPPKAAPTVLLWAHRLASSAAAAYASYHRAPDARRTSASAAAFDVSRRAASSESRRRAFSDSSADTVGCFCGGAAPEHASRPSRRSSVGVPAGVPVGRALAAARRRMRRGARASAASDAGRNAFRRFALEGCVCVLLSRVARGGGAGSGGDAAVAVGVFAAFARGGGASAARVEKREGVVGGDLDLDPARGVGGAAAARASRARRSGSGSRLGKAVIVSSARASHASTGASSDERRRRGRVAARSAKSEPRRWRSSSTPPSSGGGSTMDEVTASCQSSSASCEAREARRGGAEARDIVSRNARGEARAREGGPPRVVECEGGASVFSAL